MLVIAGDADPEHAALHPDRPYPFVALNEGVPHFCPLAKYAVAFPKMSRSIVTRANSARRRLISICSAVTCALPGLQIAAIHISNTARWPVTESVARSVIATRPINIHPTKLRWNISCKTRSPVGFR